MADVRPFAGWRYALEGTDLSAVTSPPYDVISPDQRRALLAKDEHNAVALELPEGPLDAEQPGNRYALGKRTWDRWRSEGVLVKDDRPAVYVLQQTYALESREIRRRAFIAEVKLEPLDGGVVLPHERTLPKALGDRFQLLKATGANLSQVFGLFEDPAHETDGLFDTVMSSEPIERAVDDAGVESLLWASTDPAVAEALSASLATSRIFIADGHHRYTTALAYRDFRESQGGRADEAAYDSVMMALVSIDDPDLVVLPTHRVADAPGFDSDRFKSALTQHFVLEPVPQGREHAAFEGVEGPAVLFKTRGDESATLMCVRPDVDLDKAIPLEHTSAWKCLDVAVLQELVLNPLLDIHPDRPETLERLSFYKDAHAALDAVAEHDVAFILRPTRLEQLKAVALSGDNMPQKSTYFYPKLLSGLVFRSAE